MKAKTDSEEIQLSEQSKESLDDDASRASQSAPQKKRVALVLNANAKRVTPQLVQEAKARLPDCEIFCTTTFEEAHDAAERILLEEFDTVLTGGGDGTFFGTLHEMMKVVAQKKLRGEEVRLPKFGVLKLGTGNALAALCHASGGKKLFDDVRRTQSEENIHHKDLRLVQTNDGIRVPFAGVGLDAGILNHYVETKNASTRPIFKAIFEGAFGYFWAILTKTIPAYLFRRKTAEIEVIARAPAWKFNKGDVLSSTPVPPGTCLYRGPVLLTAAGTCPYYGYHFTMFPLWNVAHDLMHLRIVAISSATLVAHLFSVWRGRFRSQDVHEYLCSDVEIRAVGEPVPYQLGGDAGGYRQAVRWSVSEEVFSMVDFEQISSVPDEMKRTPRKFSREET